MEELKILLYPWVTNKFTQVQMDPLKEQERVKVLEIELPAIIKYTVPPIPPQIN